MAKKSTHNSPAMPAMEDDYRAQSDADTLRRAGEIMGNKPRMMAAKSHMEHSMQAMAKAMGMAKGATPKASAARGHGGMSPGFAKGKR